MKDIITVKPLQPHRISPSGKKLFQLYRNDKPIQVPMVEEAASNKAAIMNRLLQS